MQIIYLSNRPRILTTTLELMSTQLDFVSDAIVCLPKFQCDKFNYSKSERLPISLIAEEDLLSRSELNALPNLNHQSRNYLLRTRLVSHTSGTENFIMSDDDARPLTPIPESYYLESGAHNSFYFHNLLNWQHYQTDFDLGQIATGSLLLSKGLTTLSFASHMPQIINRPLFNQATKEFSEASREMPLCEWSTYFNFALNQAPELFHTPKAYETLCWPEQPTAWTPDVRPSAYSFENFTPELYQSKSAFPAHDPNSSQPLDSLGLIKKITDWRLYTLRKKFPEQTRGIKKYLNRRTWTNKFFDR